MEKETKLIAVLFNTENQVLLEKYEEGYKLPSGSILNEERIEDAYKRFLLDETGLVIELLDVVSVFNFDEVNQISIAYACIPLKIYEPKKILPDKYKWFGKKEIEKLILPLPYREIVTHAYSKASLL